VQAGCPPQVAHWPLVLIQADPVGQLAFEQQYTGGKTRVQVPLRQSSPWVQPQAEVQEATGHRPELPLVLEQTWLAGHPGLEQQ